MTSHAIVIGIDAHADPAWQLTGAARDALRFAGWALAHGGVAPPDLTLLISPAASFTPANQLAAIGGNQTVLDAAQPATTDAIRKALFAYSDRNRGAGADRFWFFYAGHGAAPPGDDPSAGPVLVPADIDDIAVYLDGGPIGVEVFRDKMLAAAPSEQIYFLDACRQVIDPKTTVTMTNVAVWSPVAIKAAIEKGVPTQAAVFATSTGQHAVEVRGRGIFTKHLLQALGGCGPKLLPPESPPSQHMRLMFDDLVAYLAQAVPARHAELAGPTGLTGEQTPVGSVRNGSAFQVADFAPSVLTRFTLRTFIDPPQALGSARIWAIQFDEGTSTWVQRTTNPSPKGPPVLRPESFDLLAGRYPLRVGAPGFEDWSGDIDLHAHQDLPISLQPVPTTPGPPPGPALPGTPPAPATGSLRVTCPDRSARLALAAGTEVLAGGFGLVEAHDLSPGPYHVTAVVDRAVSADLTVPVIAGQTATATIDLPARPLADSVIQLLVDHGIDADDRYVQLVDALGPFAGLDLTTILAFAALAARLPDDPDLAALRSLGVPGVESHEPDRTTGIQVIIGSSATDPGSFLDGCDVLLARDPLDPTSDDERLALTTLAGATIAREAHTATGIGSHAVVIELPGVAPVRLPVWTIHGMDSVLVITQEGDGNIEIFQATIPRIAVTAADGRPSATLDGLRHLDLVWRARRDGIPLLTWELDQLVDDAGANPTLALLAAYAAVEPAPTPRAAIGAPSGDGRRPVLDAGDIQPAGMLPASPDDDRRRDLARRFADQLLDGEGRLPDSLLVRALVEGAGRSQIRDAMATGTPLIANGLRAGIAALAEEAVAEDRPPPELVQGLLPDLVWTAFSGVAQGDDQIRTISRTGRVERLRPDAHDLRRAADAVCRIQARNDLAPGSEHSAGFMIGPDLVLSAGFAIGRAIGPWNPKAFVPDHPDPDLPMPLSERSLGGGALLASFDPTGEAEPVEVIEIVRILLPNALGADITNPLRGLVVLRLARSVEATPLLLRSTEPPIDEPVAVIGYPQHDARLPPASTWAFAPAVGQRHIMTGTVFDGAGEYTFRRPRQEELIWHDALTSAGTGGGPLLLLDAGPPLVIGVHQGGIWAETGKANFALALTSFDLGLLADLGAEVR